MFRHAIFLPIPPPKTSHENHIFSIQTGRKKLFCLYVSFLFREQFCLLYIMLFAINFERALPTILRIALAHSFDVIVGAGDRERVRKSAFFPRLRHFTSSLLSFPRIRFRAVDFWPGISSNLVQQNVEGQTKGMEGAKAAARMGKQR